MIDNKEQGAKKKSRLVFFLGFFIALIAVISLVLFWLDRQSLDQQLLSSFDGLIQDLNGYVLLEFSNTLWKQVYLYCFLECYWGIS